MRDNKGRFMVKSRPKELPQELWDKRFKELVGAYVVIYPCKTCGSPVNDGYVCIFCDDNDPKEYDD